MEIMTSFFLRSKISDPINDIMCKLTISIYLSSTSICCCQLIPGLDNKEDVGDVGCL